MTYLDPNVESAIMSLSGQDNPVKSSPGFPMELLAIAADKLGQGFDPKNPFAGIGTQIAQSAIADRVRQEDKKKQQNMVEMVLKAMGGFTDKGMPGANSMTTTLDADGNPEHTIKFNSDSFKNAAINSPQIQQIAPPQSPKIQSQQVQPQSGGQDLRPFF
jgi:hypothetical protein